MSFHKVLTGWLDMHTEPYVYSFLGFLLSLICLALDAALSVVARNSINDALPENPASIGRALWLMIPVPILLLIASVTVCIGTHR